MFDYAKAGFLWIPYVKQVIILIVGPKLSALKSPTVMAFTAGASISRN